MYLKRYGKTKKYWYRSFDCFVGKNITTNAVDISLDSTSVSSLELCGTQASVLFKSSIDYTVDKRVEEHLAKVL